MMPISFLGKHYVMSGFVNSHTPTQILRQRRVW